MAASQMFDQMARASVARRGYGRAAGPGGTTWVLEHTGASHRQLHYWIRRGLLGARHQGLGSGARHRFDASDVEVIHALVALAALGCRDEWLAFAVQAVRAGSVNPAGERLIVELNGNAYRHPADKPTNVPGPAWVVPLSPAEVPSDSTAKPSAGAASKGAA